MESEKKGSEGPTKSKEEILAETKAKIGKKATKKSQPSKSSSPSPVLTPTPAPVPTSVSTRGKVDSESAHIAQSAKQNTLTKVDEMGKTKSELRSERRQKQEDQRAAKAAQPEPKAKHPLLPSHRQQQERRLGLLTKDLAINQGNIHPAVIKLGLQYASGIISGSNARAVALMEAFKRVISDYSTPEPKELSRDLKASLEPCINFLKQCRPISVSMGNAIRFLKGQINNIPLEYSNTKAKEELHDQIDTYIRENVDLAGKTICEKAGKKISSGDVILTYGFSSLLLRILLKAFVDDKKKFRVVVLDSSSRKEGLELLRRLVAANIPSTYMLISGASYIMPEVTKVLLGAHALLANGNVMSRVGSSQVALVAKAHNVPVLVCCETHKFCEHVQTDSLEFNDLGDPDDLISAVDGKSYVHSITNWREIENLSLLNLRYDVTPGDLVTAVITELGILPCTSVPVVLRVKHVETIIPQVVLSTSYVRSQPPEA